MYTQVWDDLTNKPSEKSVQRDSDRAVIPFDPENVDFQAYQAWLAEGNQPTPYKVIANG